MKISPPVIGHVSNQLKQMKLDPHYG